MRGFFRIRRFRTRLLLIILGLLIAALSTSYLLVTRANRTNAIKHIDESLNNAMRVFWFSVELRQERLAQSAEVVSASTCKTSWTATPCGPTCTATPKGCRFP